MKIKSTLDKESLTEFLEEYFDVTQANAIENIYKDNNIPGLVENSFIKYVTCGLAEKICERFARPAVSVLDVEKIKSLLKMSETEDESPPYRVFMDIDPKLVDIKARRIYREMVASRPAVSVEDIKNVLIDNGYVMEERDWKDLEACAEAIKNLLEWKLK